MTWALFISTGICLPAQATFSLNDVDRILRQAQDARRQTNPPLDLNAPFSRESLDKLCKIGYISPVGVLRFSSERGNPSAERECDLLTSFVAFGSESHRNLERAGLRLAYTKALWWLVE
jgi:hypothetical protein